MTTAAELHEAERDWAAAGSKSTRLTRKLWKQVTGFDWPADYTFEEGGVTYVLRARVEVKAVRSNGQA